MEKNIAGLKNINLTYASELQPKKIHNFNSLAEIMHVFKHVFEISPLFLGDWVQRIEN
jgi:hypothetical protein